MSTLDTGTLRRARNIVPFSPGPFGGGLHVLFVGVDFNHNFYLACFLGLEGSPTIGGIPIPLGVGVSGDLICLPVAFAQPKKREVPLQDVQELVPNIEGNISPSCWGVVPLQQTLEESLGRMSDRPLDTLWDLVPVLVLHIAGQDRRPWCISRKGLTSSVSTFPDTLVLVGVPVPHVLVVRPI